MTTSGSQHRQPIVTLGIPDADRTNRAALWTLLAVAFVFFLCVLAYAVASSDDDGAAALGSDPPAIVVTDVERAAGAS